MEEGSRVVLLFILYYIDGIIKFIIVGPENLIIIVVEHKIIENIFLFPYCIATRAWCGSLFLVYIGQYIYGHQRFHGKASCTYAEATAPELSLYCRWDGHEILQHPHPQRHLLYRWMFRRFYSTHIHNGTYSIGGCHRTFIAPTTTIAPTLSVDV